MTPEQFSYWLQGFSELTGGAVPTEAQWNSIREHLGRVFVKITPDLAIGPVTITPAVIPGRAQEDIARYFATQKPVLTC